MSIIKGLSPKKDTPPSPLFLAGSVAVIVVLFVGLFVLYLRVDHLEKELKKAVDAQKKSQQTIESLDQRTPEIGQPTVDIPETARTSEDIAPLLARNNTFVLGKADAPLTLVEFSDFECPYCKKYFDESFPQIKKNYIDTGKVKYVFRNFPLPFHNKAQASGLVAYCAGQQGKFWEMHDLLFENQEKWAQAEDASKLFEGYVSTLKLKKTDFTTCMKEKEAPFSTLAQEDMDDGTKAGVEGTPTVFVGTTPLVGAQPYEVFVQAIDQELAKK